MEETKVIQGNPRYLALQIGWVGERRGPGPDPGPAMTTRPRYRVSRVHVLSVVQDFGYGVLNYSYSFDLYRFIYESDF